MDIISSSGEHTITNVVAVTLFSLIEYASRESLSTLDELGKEIDADGLAVAGTHACLKALKEGRADTLIMSPIYPPEPGWMCATCGHTDAGGPHIKNRRHHAQPRATSDKQRTPIGLNLESVDREALKKMCGRVPEINRSLRRLKVPFRLKLL